MTDIPKKVALIGCGRIAGHHCLAIQAVAGAELATVCDLDIEKARKYGTEHDIPYFASYHQMFREVSGIDLAAIITPSGMHLEHSLDVVERYGKHLIVEKPTFMKPEHIDEAYKACDRLGANLYPVFQNRYNKAVTRAKTAIESGELGDVHLASVRLRWCRPQRYYEQAPWRGTYSHDGGALTNQGIHHVDLLRHLGGEIESVNASAGTFGADIEVEDSIVATFKFASGAFGSLEVTTAARPDDFEASLGFVGSEGLLQLGGIAVNELQIFTPNPSECGEHSEDFIGINGHGAVYGYGHVKMYEDIIANLADGVPYPVNQNDCHRTIQLLHAFYRSAECGNWVDVDSTLSSSRLGEPGEQISDLYRTKP